MRYDSYRVQVWRSTRLGRRQWSARLEGLQDGRHIQFNSPDALLAYLRALLDPDPCDDSPPAEGEDADRP